MADIVISEFMDEAAVARPGSARMPSLYEPDLVDRPDDLARHVADARALIVRNRTQVRGDLLAARRAARCVGRLGVGLDNIDVAACEDARHRRLSGDRRQRPVGRRICHRRRP